MKRTLLTASVGLACLLSSAPLFGQKPAPPATPATPAAPAPPATPATPAIPAAPKREPVTFLGVVAVPASAAMTEQLGLPAGFGLVVESVVPDSPAAVAGLKRFDILKSLGDQRLASADQLSALIRAGKDGDDVVFTLLRRGQEEKVTAKLAKRVPDAMSAGPGPLRVLRDLMGPGSIPRDLFKEGGPLGELRNRLSVRRGKDGSEQSTSTNLNNARMILRDDKGELEVVTTDGKRTLTARNLDGSVAFTGPINTEEERKKVPPMWMERLEKMEKSRPPAEKKPEGTASNDEELDLDVLFEDSVPSTPSVPPVPPLPPLPPNRGTPSASPVT